MLSQSASHFLLELTLQLTNTCPNSQFSFMACVCWCCSTSHSMKTQQCYILIYETDPVFTCHRGSLCLVSALLPMSPVLSSALYSVSWNSFLHRHHQQAPVPSSFSLGVNGGRYPSEWRGEEPKGKERRFLSLVFFLLGDQGLVLISAEVVFSAKWPPKLQPLSCGPMTILPPATSGYGWVMAPLVAALG